MPFSLRISDSSDRDKGNLPAGDPATGTTGPGSDGKTPGSGGRKRTLWRWRRVAFWSLLSLWVLMACWETNKPLPPGARIQSPWVTVQGSDISFIADITAADAYGRPVESQAIFDETLNVVRAARDFLVLDYFLFNDEVEAGRQPEEAGEEHPAEPGSASASAGSRGIDVGAGGTGDVGPAAPAALRRETPPRRRISGELRDALIARRRDVPGLKVLLITDPINELYGSAPSADLRLLRAAGVDVVLTDVSALRASNFAYTSLWQLAVSWWSPATRGEGWLPSPRVETASPVTFGAWTRLFNYKANQRRVMIGDDGRGGVVGIVASADPYNASSTHSNVAIKITGHAIDPLIESELQIARFSGWAGKLDVNTVAGNAADVPRGAPGANSLASSRASAAAPPAHSTDTPSGQAPRVRVLTEGAIRDDLLEHIEAAVRGETIDMAMFQLADRAIIEALMAAGRRGVNVRLILDPNKDAFGTETSGLPNQPVASELVSESDGTIHVRWYRTHGEQFHTKLVMIYGSDRLWMTAGSANLTRRTLGDYNLAANVAIDLPRGSPLALQSLEYFQTLWSNHAPLGIEYTADYAAYADPAQARYWLYRFLEGSGLADF